jgi:hypothetical protein
MEHGLGPGELYTRGWRVNLKERDHLENPIVDGLIILKWIVKK